MYASRSHSSREPGRVVRGGRERERAKEGRQRYEPYPSHSRQSSRREPSGSHPPSRPPSKVEQPPPPPPLVSLPEETRYVKDQRQLLKTLKRRSALRRKLLAKELGAPSPDELATVLCSRRELDETRRLRYKLNPSKHRATSRHDPQSRREKRKKENEDGLVETYKDSTIFMKGTQSANPHNDYSQHFVDTCQRPQNFIRDVGMDERFREYPKLNELMRLKDEQIRKGATQPMYLQCDLKTFDLSALGTKFDVILLEPPLEEYQRRASGVAFTWSPWEWEEIMNLKLEDVGAQRSFVFLWCGSCEGLDLGRECLKKWGYRRCEDICWVKTNSRNPGNNQHLEHNSILQNTKVQLAPCSLSAQAKTTVFTSQMCR